MEVYIFIFICLFLILKLLTYLQFKTEEKSYQIFKYSLQIQQIDDILDEESNSQEQLPSFEIKQPKQQKHQWILPNYKNIQAGQLVKISIVFLILQFIIYFSLETCKTYSDIDDIYYDITRDAMIFISLTCVLCSDKLLSMNSFTFIQISTQLANVIIMISLISSNLYYEYEYKQKTYIRDIQYVLQFIMTIIGGITLGLQIIGCFYYMIKSIKKTDQKLQQSQCLILAIFLSLQTLGQNFHNIIPYNSDIIFTQTILYIGTVLCLILYYCLPKITIYTYDTNELSLKELLEGIYNNMDKQIESEQQDLDLNQNDDLEECQSLINYTKQQQHLEKIKKLPKILQFYYNVLLKQTTGIKIILESLVYAFIQCTGTIYYQLYYSEVIYPTCLSQTPYSSFTPTCWMDNKLFKNYFTIQTAIMIGVLLINGFIYDFLNINTRNDLFCQQFQIIINIICCLMTIIIPAVFTIGYKPYRDAFIYLLFIAQSLSLMTIVILRQQYV